VNPVSLVAIYFILWWIAFFLTLPFGVKNVHEAEEGMTLGTDPGAPVQPWLLRKAAAATVIAALLLALVYLVFGVWEMTLEDFIV